MTAVWTLANELLDCAKDALSSNGISYPSRNYIAEGEVAFDCEQLVVQVSRLFPGFVGGEIGSAQPPRCAVPRSAEMVVWLVRCAAPMAENGDPPNAAQINATALGLLKDMWALASGIATSIADGSCFSQCQAVLVGEASLLGPQGGFGGVRLRVAAQVT